MNNFQNMSNDVNKIVAMVLKLTLFLNSTEMTWYFNLISMVGVCDANNLLLLEGIVKKWIFKNHSVYHLKKYIFESIFC